jgi:hypothetical protein
MDNRVLTTSRTMGAVARLLLPWLLFAAPLQGSLAARPGDDLAGRGAMASKPNVVDLLGLRCAPSLLAVTPDGSHALIVSVGAPPDVDLTVNLLADNPSIAGVSATATIPAGQTFGVAIVTGGTRGATFITARVDSERAGCSVYVAESLTGLVYRHPAASVLVTVGTPNDRPEPPKLAPPVGVTVLPVPFAVTQPARIDIQSP